MKLDLVDVFAGPGGLSGSPLAVVHGGETLSTAQMQRMCEWLGFSETTFLVPPRDPGADYGVRIFCPGRELPLPGTPRWARHGRGCVRAACPGSRAW
jgi:PhzF family phenazine biosynthesis protein